MPGLGCRNNRSRWETARKLWLPPVASMVLCCNRVALDLSRTYRHTTPTGFRDPSPERTRRRFQLLVPWLQHDVTLWSSNRYSYKYRATASPGRAERVPSPSAISYLREQAHTSGFGR